jgi:hypothetical protein
MTRKMIGSASALALACAVGLNAQTTTRADAANVNRDDDRGKDQTVTVVGCVQPQQGANDDEFILASAQPAESGSASGSMAGSTVGASGSEITGATGTSGNTTAEAGTSASASMTMQDPAASPAHGSYELTGDREDDLKNLAGRRIEITGTVEDNEAHDSSSTSMSHPESGASGTSGATGTSGTSGTASGSTAGTSGSAGTSVGVSDGDRADQTQSRALPRLKITSFRELSGDCPTVQQ